MQREYTSDYLQVIDIIKSIMVELSHRKEKGFSIRVGLTEDLISIDQEIDGVNKEVTQLPFDQVIDFGPDVVVDLITNERIRKR